ncbi:hypothetical protein [Alkalilacustris brevis]|uniref:hypothetical protein n=1 Tax=Alkalilacustris brevis TaxID=2026338 RepID=UPI000E0D537E|nr:hypothetical protein [Alkalilacustris brevis]
MKDKAASRLILHTGAHKTGTTTLQHSFAQNRDLLARHGLIYPHVGPNMGHHALTAIWCDRSARLPKGFFAEKGPGRMLQEIVAAHASSNRTVLLSSEAFSQGSRMAVDMADLRRRVAAFDQVGVIHVLREQCGFLQSVYLELARRAVMEPFADFLARALRSNRVAGLWGEHGALYDHLLKGFAPGEICFADFDHLRTSRAGLVRFFLRQAGAESAAAQFVPLARDRNTSPEPLAMWLAQQTIGPHVPGPGVISVAQDSLREQFGADCRTTLYTRREAAAVQAHFAPLNATFAARIKPFQPDFALSKPHMPAGRVHREDLTQEVQRSFLARLEGRRAQYRAANPRLNGSVRGHAGPSPRARTKPTRLIAAQAGSRVTVARHQPEGAD